MPNKKPSLDIYIKEDSLDAIAKRLHIQPIATKASISLENNKVTYTLNDTRTGKALLDQQILKDRAYHQKLIDELLATRTKRFQKLVQILSKIDPRYKSLQTKKSAPRYISVTLTPAQLTKFLVMQQDLIEYVDMHTTFSLSAGNYSLDEWIDTRRVYKNITSIDRISGYQGDNISVFYTDAGCFSNLDELRQDPTFINSAYKTPISYTTINKKYSSHEHTEIVTGTLTYVAQNIKHFCQELRDVNDNSIYQLLPSSTIISEINLESYSLNDYENDNTRLYTKMDQVTDQHNYVYRTKPIFIAAGNKKNSLQYLNVLPPARAFNVTTVGMYDLTQTFISSSRYIDPKTGNSPISKLEVMGPGKNFYYTSNSYNCYMDNNSPNGTYECRSTGTSFATPWVAAMAARAMSQSSFWQNSAAVIKALVIAGATDKINNADRDKAGEGGVDQESIIGADRGGYTTFGGWWYDYDPDRPFRYGSCVRPWQITLHGRNVQRVALAWLTNVKSQNISRIPQHYSLRLIDANNNVIASANTPNQNYQLLSDQLSYRSGTYTIEICRNYNDNDSRFDIGVAVVQRDD